MRTNLSSCVRACALQFLSCFCICFPLPHYIRITVSRGRTLCGTRVNWYKYNGTYILDNECVCVRCERERERDTCLLHQQPFLLLLGYMRRRTMVIVRTRVVVFKITEIYISSTYSTRVRISCLHRKLCGGGRPRRTRHHYYYYYLLHIILGVLGCDSTRAVRSTSQARTHTYIIIRLQCSP